MQPRYSSIFRPDLFAGQVALVTGGGTGIGRCIGHELAALGATVIVVGRREEPLRAVAAEINEDGGQAAWCSLNIRDEDEVEKAIAALVDRHGAIDVLVNNAGGQFMCEAEGIRAKGWRAVIDTNLNGTFWVTQAVFRHSMAARGGAIVNIVADMWNGFPGMAHTGAARAAVVNLTQTLAIEWASRGVRVNAVAPGTIVSSGLANYPEALQEMVEGWMRLNPAARMGTESEVSAATAFLLSPAAAYVSGATLRVDGGSSLAKQPTWPLDPHEKLKPYNGMHRANGAPERFQPGACRKTS